MKRNRFIITGLILIVTITFLSGPVSAVSFHIDDAQFTSAGQTITRDLICDELPQGLSGFNISISVNNPSVGVISGVVFPDWAVLKTSSTVPASSVWLKAIDMNNQVKPGDTNVVFAHIIVKGNILGTTGFTITPVELDDENGNPIVTTAYVPPTTAVPAAGAPESTVAGPTTTSVSESPVGTYTTPPAQSMTPGVTIESPTPLPAAGKEGTVPTPQVIYVNATPVVVYVTVTQKTPVSPFLAFIAVGLVGMGLAIRRRLER